MAAKARDMAASGDLGALCAGRGVKGSWLASAVAAESRRSVSPSTVSRWMRGLMLPDGERAVALFKVVDAVVTAAGTEGGQ